LDVNDAVSNNTGFMAVKNDITHDDIRRLDWLNRNQITVTNRRVHAIAGSSKLDLVPLTQQFSANFFKVKRISI